MQPWGIKIQTFKRIALDGTVSQMTSIDNANNIITAAKNNKTTIITVKH